MSYKVERVNPYHPDKPKKEQIIHMFNEIAPGYDKLNGALSLGIDNYWRSDALKVLKNTLTIRYWTLLLAPVISLFWHRRS